MKVVRFVTNQPTQFPPRNFTWGAASFPSQPRAIGAPLVAVVTSENLAHLGNEMHRKKLPVRSLTAVARFERNAAILELNDPYQAESTTIAGRSRPLACDYGAATMFAMSKSREDKLGIARLLRTSLSNDTGHLNFLQP